VSEDAEPAERKKRKKKKKAKEQAPARPGAGTADGELLADAEAAFERGDYVLVRKRTRELVNASDPEVKAAAADLAARIAIDPVQVGIVVACAIVLAIIVYVWVF